MVSDELGKQLHDRATRGEALSPEEQAQLKDWYATQDRAEADQLGFTGGTLRPKATPLRWKSFAT